MGVDLSVLRQCCAVQGCLAILVPGHSICTSREEDLRCLPNTALFSFTAVHVLILKQQDTGLGSLHLQVPSVSSVVQGSGARLVTLVDLTALLKQLRCSRMVSKAGRVKQVGGLLGKSQQD